MREMQVCCCNAVQACHATTVKKPEPSAHTLVFPVCAGLRKELEEVKAERDALRKELDDLKMGACKAFFCKN